MPQIAPLLDMVRRFTQHEGKKAVIARADSSSDAMNYRRKSFQFELDREGMRRGDTDAVFRQMEQFAEELASSQVRDMLEDVSAAAASVGNTIDAGGDLRSGHFLEMLEKIQTDFDPDTLEPTGQVFVVHPDVMKKLLPKIKEWEGDPHFIAEHERIRKKQLEAWRARTANRRLVD